MMGILTTAVIIGLIPALIAQHKGYSFLGWWLFGAALFIVALPVAIMMKPDASKRRQCPLCRTSIDAAAVVCPQCGRDIAELPASA